MSSGWLCRLLLERSLTFLFRSGQLLYIKDTNPLKRITSWKDTSPSTFLNTSLRWTQSSQSQWLSTMETLSIGPGFKGRAELFYRLMAHSLRGQMQVSWVMTFGLGPIFLGGISHILLHLLRTATPMRSSSEWVQPSAAALHCFWHRCSWGPASWKSRLLLAIFTRSPWPH